MLHLLTLARREDTAAEGVRLEGSSARNQQEAFPALAEQMSRASAAEDRNNRAAASKAARNTSPGKLSGLPGKAKSSSQRFATPKPTTWQASTSRCVSFESVSSGRAGTAAGRIDCERIDCDSPRWGLESLLADFVQQGGRCARYLQRHGTTGHRPPRQHTHLSRRNKR